LEFCFIVVLYAEMVLFPVLGGRHIYFRYKATSGFIIDNTVEQLDRENTGIAVTASNIFTIG